MDRRLRGGGPQSAPLRRGQPRPVRPGCPGRGRVRLRGGESAGDRARRAPADPAQSPRLARPGAAAPTDGDHLPAASGHTSPVPPTPRLCADFADRGRTLPPSAVAKRRYSGKTPPVSAETTTVPAP